MLHYDHLRPTIWPTRRRFRAENGWQEARLSDFFEQLLAAQVVGRALGLSPGSKRPNQLNPFGPGDVVGPSTPLRLNMATTDVSTERSEPKSAAAVGVPPGLFKDTLPGSPLHH